MKKAEYPGSGGCPQRNSAEHEEYAGAQSIDTQETEEADSADLLEKILDRENLNRAYKRVKANKGAPGIDGMTVEDALSWLREHGEELLEQIRSDKYKPQPVKRKLDFSVSEEKELRFFVDVQHMAPLEDAEEFFLSEDYLMFTHYDGKTLLNRLKRERADAS